MSPTPPRPARSTRLRLRAAGPADDRSLAAIAWSAYSTYTARMDVPPAPMTADYGRLVAEAEVILAEVDGEVAGFVAATVDGVVTNLENVAVDPARQGQGIGRILIAAVEDAAARRGSTCVRLFTNEVMVENQRLYERLGYVEVQRVTEGPYRRIYYEKRLAGGG